jgi:hypothetical protein
MRAILRLARGKPLDDNRQVKGYSQALHALLVIAIASATFLAGVIITFSQVVSVFVLREVPRKSGLDITAYASWPLVLVALTVLAIRWQVAWKWTFVGAVIPVALLAFLVHDGRRVDLPDMGPRSSRDDAGYRVVMWFGKGSPYSRVGEAAVLDTKEAEDRVRLPEDAATWTQFVSSHRNAIEAAWNDFPLGQEWAQRVAQNPPQGVWPGGATDPPLDFHPIRRLMVVTNAHAYLLAVDGTPDRGLQELMPVIQSMYVVQRTGPLLLNQMIATVVLKDNYAVARAILKQKSASEKSRSSLRELLEAAPRFAQKMHNAFAGEAEFASGILDQAKSGLEPLNREIEKFRHGVGLGMRVAGPLVLNRNNSIRYYMLSMREVEAFAVARNLDALDKWKPPSPPWPQQLKNPMGRLVDSMLIPAFAKAVHGFWSEEDGRVDLLKQLDDAPSSPVLESRAMVL